MAGKDDPIVIKTIVGVDGMMCSMCEAHVNDAVRKACSIQKVTSDHKKGECVIISDTSLNAEQLSSAIEATGYRVTSLREEPYLKKGFFSFGR